MNNPKVLISILNWKTPENTIQTVRSVLLSSYDNYKIILLDNDSNDNSEYLLKEAFPQLQFLKMHANLGYAGAHKKSADYALKNSFDLLWLLNNDVHVYKSTLEELVNAHQRNNNSILGSIEVGSDGETIQFGGGAEILNNFDNDEHFEYNRYAGKKISDTDITERPVADLCGASILIPVPIIKSYGFIDIKFFLYAEETDYCYKLRRLYGIQSLIVPSSIIIHANGGSFKFSNRLQFVRVYYQSRNSHYLFKKYFKNYVNKEVGGLLHYIKFFINHYIIVKQLKKDHTYWLYYYKKLGHFHAIIKLRGKYLDPNRFLTEERKSLNV